MKFVTYMKQTCGTSLEDVHKMTTEAIETSKNPALGTIKVDAVESVAMTRTLGKLNTENEYFHLESLLLSAIVHLKRVISNKLSIKILKAFEVSLSGLTFRSLVF